MRWQATYTYLGLAGLLAAAATCADLGELEGGICGNGVVEADEDCEPLEGDNAVDGCGAVHGDQPCRWICNDTTSCPVDEAWGCSVVGICRQASGTFELAGEVPLDAEATELGVGDFDADGRDDLVTVTTRGDYQAAYFGDDGRLQSTFLFASAMPGMDQRPATAPVVGELSGDGVDDVAVAQPEALFVGRGQRDRTILPTSYSPYVIGAQSARGAVLEVLPTVPDPESPEYGEPQHVGDELLVLFEPVVGPNEAATTRARCLTCATDDYTPEDAVMAGNMLQRLSLATGRAAFAPTCAAVAFAKKDDRQVSVSALCTSDGKFNTRLFSSSDHIVALAGDAKVGENAPFGYPDAVRLVDVNGDGRLDLLVQTADGASCAAGASPLMSMVYVAYGTDAGFAGADDVSNVAEPLCPGQVVGAQYSWLSMPMAVADLNGDGVADLAMPGTLLLSAGAAEGAEFSSTTYQNAGFAYEGGSIEAADVNADGAVDLIVATQNALSVTYYQGNGHGAFSEFSVAAAAPLRGYGIGDFDGDGLQDLAFAETAEDSGSNASEEAGRLSVAFGQAFGPPSAPITMAWAPVVEWVAVGNLQHSEFVDATSDLLLASRSSEEAALSLAEVEGSGDRHLFAPLLFIRGTDTSRKDQPLGLSVGRYSTLRPGAAGIAAFSGPSGSAAGMQTAALGATSSLAWLLQPGPQASIDSATLEPVELDPSCPVADTCRWAMSVTASLDADVDGTDELVVLTPMVETDLMTGVEQPVGTLVALLHANDAATGWLSPADDEVQAIDDIVARAAGRGWLGAEVYYANELDGSQWETLQSAKAARVDVDHDGHLDLAVLGLSRACASSSHPLPAPALLLFFVDEAGAAGSLGRLCALPDDPILDFEFVQADADLDSELALATPSGVFISEVVVERTGGAASMSLANSVALAANEDGVSGAERVAAGDFNGDGVQDLALARGAGIDVYLGKAVLR